MRTLWRLALALAPAGMLGAYASYPAMAFLPWVALVPWVVLYADDRNERPSYLYYGLGAYAAWILQYPQAWRFGWYAPFVLGLAFLPFWIPFAPLLSWLHRRVRLPRALTVALAWTTVEWLRSTLAISHFDLYGLGYSQARFPLLVQFTDLTGVYGVSFLIAAVNGWLADCFLVVREFGWKRFLWNRSVTWGGIAVAVSLVLVSGYGAWRLISIQQEPGPRLALVQTNLPHSKENLVEVHLDQLLMTEQRVPAGQVDLVVWPENAILDDIRRKDTYLDDLAWLAREKDAWFLVGALGQNPERPGYTTNGAWLVDTNGHIRGAYHKQVLFPWSEYIPGDRILGRWFPGLQRSYRWITRLGWGQQPSGTAGDRMEIMELPLERGSVRFAPLICVENVYPPLPARAGRLGADFFVNVTSEGLVGGPVQEQLLRIAILRAIENRMSYVRVGNSGISGVIDATGRVVRVLRGDNGNTINTPGTLLVDVPIAKLPATVYANSRDFFAKLVVGITLLLAAASWLRPRGISRLGASAVGAALLLTGCTSPPSLDGSASEVPANLARGRAFLSEALPHNAVAPLAAACATEAGCREALPLLHQALAMGKSDDDAAITFGEIAGRYPSLRSDALIARGFYLERILELQSAREAYLASLESGPSVVAYERLGRLEVRMNRPEDAMHSFRAGLELEPGNSRLRYLLGRALFFAGKPSEAENVLTALVGDDPDHASAWTLLAWIHLENGDEAGAESLLGVAMRLPSVPVETRYVAAKLDMRRRDWTGVERTIVALRAAP